MIKFGTGGWRAVIADEFTKANIRLVAAGLCGLMKAEGLEGTEVCVGYDRRFLSKEACHWVAEVLAGYGYKPLVVNRSSPTPLIMFTVKQYDLPYGMAVTASHNPAIYNGIKVFTAGGRDADKTVTNKIEAEIAKVDPAAIPEVDYDVALEQGKIREIYPFNEYIDSILQFLDVEKIKASRLRIAVDPMYGVSQSSLRTILMTCRCDVDVIHDQHDTLFGGKMPAPSADTLHLLSNYVVDNHCNLGLATDGDADRLGVIDEEGNFLEPDRIKARGESSGGMAVRGHIAGKDGIYAAALLVEMLAVTGKSISELYKEITDKYGMLYYEDAAFTMKPARKTELQELLFVQEQLPDFGKEIDHVSRADGCKVFFKDGSWIICRFSGTEPLLRMAAEGETRAQALDYIHIWRNALDL